MNRFFRDRSGCFFLPGVFSRGHQKKLHISQQPHFPLFGVIFHSDGIAGPIRKYKFHRLVRARQAAHAIKDHAAGFHVHFLLRHNSWIFCRALGFRPALQVELDFPAASDVSARFLILAALRMNDVVALSGFPEDGNSHIFQQAGVLIAKIRGLRRFHREDFLIPFHL